MNLVASYQSALQYLLSKNSAALDVKMFSTNTSVCFSLEKVFARKAFCRDQKQIGWWMSSEYGG